MKSTPSTKRFFSSWLRTGGFRSLPAEEEYGDGQIGRGRQENQAVAQVAGFAVAVGDDGLSFLQPFDLVEKKLSDVHRVVDRAMDRISPFSAAVNGGANT
jgi:hypothetical protein